MSWDPVFRETVCLLSVNGVMIDTALYYISIQTVPRGICHTSGVCYLG